MKVEIYSDVMCPWCYIGERRFTRALAAFPGSEAVEVVFRPYQLDPGAPEKAVPLKRYLTERYGPRSEAMLSQVSAAASGERITIDWENAQSVNTRTAHRLLRLAEREYGPDVQRALLERLFDAHFSKGGDVADTDLLTRLAVEAGMDEQRVRDYLASGEGAAELEREFDHARALGVRSVPTFVFDGQYAVEGAQPASTFLQVLEEVRQRSEPESGLTGGGEGEDGCVDGSCAVG
jgi:predicted DsbA family dithiol-disulfide isomerase